MSLAALLHKDSGSDTACIELAPCSPHRPHLPDSLLPVQTRSNLNSARGLNSMALSLPKAATL